MVILLILCRYVIFLNSTSHLRGPPAVVYQPGAVKKLLQKTRSGQAGPYIASPDADGNGGERPPGLGLLISASASRRTYSQPRWMRRKCRFSRTVRPGCRTAIMQPEFGRARSPAYLSSNVRAPPAQTIRLSFIRPVLQVGRALHC